MLNELLQEEINEVQDTSFKVTDLESANWCFRKLHALEEKEKDFNNLANQELSRINNWLKSETSSIYDQKEFFKGLLAEYSVQQRTQDSKFKISTPYGKVSFRKAQPKWNYDEEKLLEFLKANGYTEYVRTKEEVNKADLKKAATIKNNMVVLSTGEIVECITIEEQPESLKIETEA